MQNKNAKITSSLILYLYRTNMNNLSNIKILLGITGGISAYKSVLLLRELTKLGAKVKVVMTKSAEQFVTPLTLQTLSGEIVRSAVFDLDAEHTMNHIELARWADFILIAPASANFIAKMAHGFADCLLSTLYLAAANTAIIVCPAMNQAMWQHPATQSNCQILKKRNIMLVGPNTGIQACGEFGPGRLAEISEIINAINLFKIQGILRNNKVLITAGPTRENIDPVRYLSNYSSGKMGYAIASAAIAAGAHTTLVSGPTNLTPPTNCNFIAVKNAQQMFTEVQANIDKNTIFISCAAVADYTVIDQAHEKIKKSAHNTLDLQLQKNPDILKEMSLNKLGKYHVGFAAETQNLMQNAHDKFISKQLDMLVANQVGENIGFESDENSVTIITANDKLQIENSSKIAIAASIIQKITQDIRNKLPLREKVQDSL